MSSKRELPEFLIILSIFLTSEMSIISTWTTILKLWLLSIKLAQIEDDLPVDPADEVIGPDVRPPCRAVLFHGDNLYMRISCCTGVILP